MAQMHQLPPTFTLTRKNPSGQNINNDFRVDKPVLSPNKRYLNEIRMVNSTVIITATHPAMA